MNETKILKHTYPLSCSVCGKTPSTMILTINGKWTFMGQEQTLEWVSKPPYEMQYFCNILCIMDFLTERKPELAKEWKEQSILPNEKQVCTE